MMDIVEQRLLTDALRELKIDALRFPVRNVEKDMIAINREGMTNLEAIEKWERIRNKVMAVI
jgi:hypothetical protein